MTGLGGSAPDPPAGAPVGPPGVDPALVRAAMEPDLRIGHGILAPMVRGLGGQVALLTQPEPLAAADPIVAARADVTVMVESLALADLEAMEAALQPVDRVMGMGGGMTMDAAKYVAWRRGVPLVLAPSIVSVDAAVTNTVAIRRGGSVVYEGFVVAEAIVADLDLIQRAPARLNRAGVGDLLSIHTGLADWRLGARAGRIAFDEAVAMRARRVLDGLLDLGDEVAAVEDVALEVILRGYALVNELCLRVGHSGPEEGSEHYLAYRLEAVTGRSFVHGELIALGTVLMSRLQGNEPERIVRFLDRCRVAWRPAEQGLDAATLRLALLGLAAFVRGAGLPWSVIDEGSLDASAVDRLLEGIA